LTSSTTRGPSTVLLVEDNPADAFLARRILADTDDPSPTVETEDRLAGAIQRLARGGVDVVVLDLGLRDSKGLESFERLRREAPDVPLVILSGLEDQAIAVEGVQSELVLGVARLEGLERINDRFGRVEGDRVVRDTATILHTTFRETDVLARAGGDRFTILLRDAGPHSTDQARHRLVDHLYDYNSGLDRPFHISIRLGFCVQVPRREDTLEHLLRSVDLALRFADKEESRNARAS
jgi:diguanylate cyclase (GGDEF)-like protein